MELMIAMAIVAILAAVALPSYNSYIRRGKIPEATSVLSSQRVKMEQFFQDNRTYVGAPAPTDTSTNFDFSVVTSATGYTLTATGKGSMTGFTYTIDQANTKASTVTGVSGWSGSATCWVTKAGGVC